MTRTCPTCSQETDKNSEAIVQARIATRPMAGPAQARRLTKLEAELTKTKRKQKETTVVASPEQWAVVETALEGQVAILEERLIEKEKWINAKCTISGCWKSKYEEGE